MRFHRIRIGAEDGLTLVEMLASMLIFAIVSLGVVPLVASSIRGAATSRSFTVGKNLASEAMERVRGLPFYISYNTKNQKVDLLDFYFPNGGSPMFTVTCPPGSGNEACHPGIPDNFTLVYQAEFVKAAGGTPETYSVVAPPASYSWSSTPADLPPSQLLRMNILVQWTQGATAREVNLTSLISDRKFAAERVKGFGKADFAVKIIAAYNDPVTTAKSDLVVIGGSAESRIETRALSQADQSAEAATLTLIRPGGILPAQDMVAPGSQDGAKSSYHAPPNADPATGASAPSRSVFHDDTFEQVASMAASDTTGLKVTVVNELPTAAGTGRLNPLGAPGTDDVWVDNQADATPGSPLQLDPFKPIVRVLRGGTVFTRGTSTATTGAIGAANRRVEMTADVAFDEARIMPVTYIPATEPQGAVVIVKNFVASVQCKSTPAGGALANAAYSGQLKYWVESNPNDKKTQGGYVTLNLAGTQATDPLAPVKASNPMVYELSGDNASQGNVKDAYMFPVTHQIGSPGPGGGAHTAIHNHPGYFTDWSSLRAADLTAIVAEAGRVTSASLSGAIKFTTAQTNPGVPQSQMNVAFGSVSCEAVDRR